MITVIDTNILLDFLGADSNISWLARQAIARAASSGPGILCPVVYAELAFNYQQQSNLDQLISELGLVVENFSQASLWQTAEAWKVYLRRRGQQLICPRCGQSFSAACPACQSPLV